MVFQTYRYFIAHRRRFLARGFDIAKVILALYLAVYLLAFRLSKQAEKSF